MTVLDAPAVLAYLLDEAGAEVVEEALASGAVIGAVNLAEVLSKLVDAGEDPVAADLALDALPLDVLPFDRDVAVTAAGLRRGTIGAGLSLGDRACLAVGRMLGEPVLTADRVWLGLVEDVPVHAIR